MITVGTDTYISLADAQAYASNNGLTLGANDAATETLLKRATIAIDRIYGNKFLGQKASETQSLAWPRNFASATIDSDGNPRDFSGLQPETGYAEVELAALLQAGTDPYVQPEPFLSQIRQKVATLEEEKQFKASQGYRTDPLYKITLILRPLLMNQSGSVSITRGA